MKNPYIKKKENDVYMEMIVYANPVSGTSLRVASSGIAIGVEKIKTKVNAIANTHE
jgi:hypothetical protein